MGYEAQIAGVTDDNPFTRALDPAKTAMKRLSRPDVTAKRAAIAGYLKDHDVEIEFFNGGGTGSLHSTASRHDPVTEVTAGSGLLCSHLFSYYRGYDFVAAAFFALQVVREPRRGMVTCQGGGYVASGESGPDRLPVPFLPEGCRLLRVEGAGEVQTPVILPPGVRLEPGAPVIFRHAKAGELAERFNEYLFVRDGAIIDRQPTYRGMGKTFL
jgi:D-serine deaminase-like pyridoxal phosphate-dependent protein